MSKKLVILRLECLRCGHTWAPRQADVARCPRCQSARWDQARESDEEDAVADRESGAHDLLGVAPISRAIERATDSALSGVEALLSRVCLPAAEEYGLHLKDKVSAWRTRNAEAILLKARPMLETAAAEQRHAPPRLIMESLLHASWSDDDDVQQMWAGLLGSSCTAGGKDDSNWVFIGLLSNLTVVQVRIVKASCERARKYVTPNGLIGASPLHIPISELIALSQCDDVQRLDREMDHLRSLGLLASGFDHHAGSFVDLAPMPLGLHLFVRAHGSLQSPVDYFGLSDRTPTAG